MKQVLGFILFFLATSPLAHAMPPFVGDDYSGEYTCKGKNDSVGEYEVLVTLKLNPVTSHDIYGIYDFNTESNKQAMYVGQIMAKGRKFSMTFKLLGTNSPTYSTGMGEFKKDNNQRWAFSNTYYEPDGNGGNFGNDYCTLEKPIQKTSKKLIPMSSNNS